MTKYLKYCALWMSPSKKTGIVRFHFLLMFYISIGSIFTISSTTKIRYIKDSNIVGDINTWECYNSNTSARGTKWFRKDHLGITELIEEETSRILNYTLHPSHNQNYYICEIEGESTSSKILNVKSKLYYFIF